VISVGDAIRNARRERGLSQLQLAMAARTTQDRISDLEAGTAPNLETLIRIAEALELPLMLGSHSLCTIELPRLVA
jgi:transcriptional regulator with XRE-family HTH domain